MSAWLAVRFSEFSSKVRNVLPGRLPIRVARIAVKSKMAGAELRLKLGRREGDRLAVIIRARDLEFGWCSHTL